MSFKSPTPFLLKGATKDYLWGGSRLKDDFGKVSTTPILAESWECSTHPNGESIIASGSYTGLTLTKVLKKHPKYLGSNNYNKEGKLPILIKFIDAKKDLSIQVHPSDEYAYKYENKQLGKTEMWYVLDAKDNATLTYGFHKNMNKELVKKAIENNTISKYLNKVKIHSNEIYLINSGTVHAINAGALVIEIQENSDLTYRLYDYDRVDKNGKKRELHISKALDVINYSAMKTPNQPMRVLKYKPGFASELLCRCKYFQVERVLINTETVRDYIDFEVNPSSFTVLVCYSGMGSITDKKNYFFNFYKGDTIFVPANTKCFKLNGEASLLKVGC